MSPAPVTLITIVLFLCGALPMFSQDAIPKDLTITLERTMCFGWCPAYTLTITADGAVKFTPEGSFAQRGDWPTLSLPLTGEISHDELKDLVAEFQKIGFLSLKTRYGSLRSTKTNSSCPEYWTDSAWALVTISSNGKRKTVHHYHGCKGTDTLERLLALEDKIDDTANAKQWISQFGWGAPSVVDLSLSTDELNDLNSNKQVRVKTKAVDPENDVLTYNYMVSGGRVIGTGAEVIWELTNVPIGTYTITAAVDDGCGICGRTVTKKVTIK